MLWDALTNEDSHLLADPDSAAVSNSGRTCCGIPADEIASCTDARRPRGSDA